MVDKIRQIEKEGMLMGVSCHPGCWKNPMEGDDLIDDEEEEEDDGEQ